MIMQQNKYLARITYEDDIEKFHGVIMNINDVIDFYGSDVTELKTEFKRSLDIYLEFCKSKNKAPDKPFSGRFNLRLTPAQHQQLVTEAEHADESLNNYIIHRLFNKNAHNAYPAHVETLS